MPESNPVTVIQNWMEQEIIGKGLCPPLVKVAQEYRDSDGKLDWSRFSRVVVTQDLTHLDPSSQELLIAVATPYLRFIMDSMAGTIPLAHNFILPDFETNDDFLAFKKYSQSAVVDELMSTQKGQIFSRVSVRKVAEGFGFSDESIRNRLRQRGGTFRAAKYLVEDCFRGADFFGQELSDGDIVNFPDNRGPVERYKMLSRAPYYLLQLLNSPRTEALAAGLNRDRLHTRNTDIALGIDIDEYETVMQTLREQGFAEES